MDAEEIECYDVGVLFGFSFIGVVVGSDSVAVKYYSYIVGFFRGDYLRWYYCSI